MFVNRHQFRWNDLVQIISANICNEHWFWSFMSCIKISQHPSACLIHVTISISHRLFDIKSWNIYLLLFFLFKYIFILYVFDFISRFEILWSILIFKIWMEGLFFYTSIFGNWIINDLMIYHVNLKQDN